MYKSKKQNGITLIALIITIIILLILAGVAINVLIGENGLFKIAKNAVTDYDEDMAREKLEVELASLQTDKFTNPKYNEQEYIDNRITENNMNISGDIVTVNGWQFQIDRSVPKIVTSFGKGKESSNINIASVIDYTENFTKGTISITITSNTELSTITVNGENISATHNNDGTYTVMKNINDNGMYNVYVKDVNDEYKLKNIKVLGIQKDIKIYTEDDFIQFAEVVNKGGVYEGKTVTLAKDLDLSSVCYKVDGTVQNDISWTPIGTESNKFKGTFDGNNKEIRNIYINSNDSSKALFGSIGTTGTVKNVKVRGTISGNNNCAGIVCRNYGKVENCVNYANVTTSGSNSGGIVSNNMGIIYRCINNGNIIASIESSGGIASTNGWGALRAFIMECINNGNVTSSSWVSGGITGSNGEGGNDLGGYICNSYNTGTILGGMDRRAGIAGQVRCKGGKSYIYNCYNRGNIAGCPEILGYVWDPDTPVPFFTNVLLNNYGMADATVEKLNEESNVEQALKDTGLYRTGAWTLKDGNIALDWE